MDIGPTEILIVLLVIVILFGAKKLPELARSLGRSSSEFKRGLKDGATEEDRALPDPRTEPKSEASTPQPSTPEPSIPEPKTTHDGDVVPPGDDRTRPAR